MTDTSGFYLYQDGELFYAPNFVIGKDFELQRHLHDQYDYPVCGWQWFDSREAAVAALEWQEDAKDTPQ